MSEEAPRTPYLVNGHELQAIDAISVLESHNGIMDDDLYEILCTEEDKISKSTDQESGPPQAAPNPEGE